MPHVFGTDLWAYLAQHPADNAVFNASMTGLSTLETAAVVAAYDFAGIDTLGDVAGGHGALLAAILTAHPTMRGILVDLPHVVAEAAAPLQAARVAARCRTMDGDMFASLPEGGDAYTLKSILHDWDDDPAAAILRTRRAAMPARATLVLVEHVLAPGNTSDPGKFQDLNMLVALGGRERTAAEFDALLAAGRLHADADHPDSRPRKRHRGAGQKDNVSGMWSTDRLNGG